jgi:serine/threonine protein phosphatase PrpC
VFAGPAMLAVADGVGQTTEALDAATAVIGHISHLPQDGSWPGPGALAGLPDKLTNVLATNRVYGDSTLALAALGADGRLWVFTLGDSRVVVVRRRNLVFASRPHNQLALDHLLDPYGHPDPRAGATLLRSCQNHWRGADIALLSAQPGDLVAVFSDGLEAALGMAGIWRCLREADSPAGAMGGLRDRLGDARLRDNTSVALAAVNMERPTDA